MEAQYYTPSLSEFHIGFEFEAKEPDSDKWLPFTFTSFQSLNHIHGLIEAGCVRVKRLDADDIVGCGWGESKTQKSQYRHIKYEQQHCWLMFMPENEKNVSIGCGWTNYFLGTIRNKSELLDQMQRCGIEAK